MPSVHRSSCIRGTLTEKILSTHLVDGQVAVGEEVGIRIDQTPRRRCAEDGGTDTLIVFPGP